MELSNIESLTEDEIFEMYLNFIDYSKDRGEFLAVQCYCQVWCNGTLRYRTYSEHAYCNAAYYISGRCFHGTVDNCHSSCCR